MESNENFQNEKTLSFSDIWNVLKKKIWIILAVSAVAAIVAGLVVMFAVNKKSETYTASFEIDYPDYSEEINPDGSKFFFTDMLTDDVLSTAKQSDKLFSSVDIDDLVVGKDIKISRSQVTDSSNKAIDGRYLYKIVISAKYFSNDELAGKYLEAVANAMLDEVKSKIDGMSFDAYLKTAQNLTSYSDKLSYFSKSRTAILEKYDELIEKYGTFYTVNIQNEKKSLADLRSEAEQNDKYTLLSRQLSVGGYLSDVSADKENELLVSLKGYLINHSDNVKKINYYKEILADSSSKISATDSDVFYTAIKTIVDSNVSIERTIENTFRKLAFIGKVQNKTVTIPETYKFDADSTALVSSFDEIKTEVENNYSAEEYESFKNGIAAYSQEISNSIESLKLAIKSVYDENSRVLAYNCELTDHTGTLTVAIVVFVLAFVISSFAVYIFCKEKPEKVIEEEKSSSKPE